MKAPLVQLNTCCWMAAASESERDTFLVIGGSDGLIQLLSVARSCVLSHLEGHTDAVVNVEAHPTRKGLLLSVGKDCRVFLWDCYPPTLPSRKPLCCFATSALCTCVSSDGRWFLTGEANGALQRWDIPSEYLTGASTASPHDQDTTAQLPTLTEHQAIAATHGADIDCIRRVGSYGFASKSVDGRIILWRHDQTSPTLIEQANIRIAGCNRQVTSRFDVCQEGRFLCAGNAQGAVFLYDLRPTAYPAAGEGRSNGSDKGDISQPQLLTRLEYRRRGNASSGKAAVRCCVFSADSRHVLVAGCEPYLWRWSAPPETTHPPPPGDSKSGTPTNENIEQEEEEEQQEEEEEEQEQEVEEDEEEKNKKPRKKAKLSS
ncbi:putative AT-rich interactive domain-containing protein 4A [Balamuthia mandrillaris]